MLFKYLLLSFFVLEASLPAESSKILGIFWTPSKSHHILGAALMQALAQKGHDVTLMSSFVDDVNITNFKQVKLEGIIGLLDTVSNKNVKFIDQVKGVYNYVTQSTENFYKNPAIQELMKTKHKYDVIITLNFFNDAILGLNVKLGIPTVVFFSGSSNPLINKYVANPNMVSYFHQGFLDRVYGTAGVATFSLFFKYLVEPLTNGILKKYIPDSPHVSDLQKHVALVLVNSHISIETPRPYVPNMVQIGGFYAQRTKPLPKELQKYLDEAKHGAVLFSFGTNMKIGTMDKDKLEAVFEVLKSLSPMKVLFKSEIALPQAPNNVLVSKWMPQNDILAHPNLKVFISHGGLGSITEAVYHGVPMLGIPLFADQKQNILIAIEAGYAVHLPYEDITPTNFEKALKELLNNREYAENAQKRSKLLRNQLIDPLKKAIWWVEHIIEFKGGDHLRNAAMDLTWYQMYMVDVMLFYLCVISLIAVVWFYVTRLILRKLINRFSKKVKTA